MKALYLIILLGLVTWKGLLAWRRGRRQWLQDMSQYRGLLEYLMGTEVIFMDTDDYADIYAEMDRIGESLGVPFAAETFDADMGQPFRNLSDAVRFFRLYDPQTAVTEAEALSRLTETGDPVFPYYLPALRSVGMIVIRARDIPR